jgi:hypothetical protein
LAAEGAKGEKDVWCFGKLTCKEGRIPYWKPEPLLKVLRKLFNIEPKLNNAKVMCGDRMKVMRDEAGGLLLLLVKVPYNWYVAY